MRYLSACITTIANSDNMLI